MEKSGVFVRKTAYKFVLLLMGMQVILGLAWIGSNLLSLHEFQSSNWYLDAAATLVFDEYVGVLYPVILRIFLEVEKLIGLPFFIMATLIQLGVSFGASVFFLKKTFFLEKEIAWYKDWTLLLGAMYMITFPVLAKFHVAILPASLVCSIYLLLLGECLSLLKDGKLGKSKMARMGRMGIFYLISALLVPEYIWFGGLLLLATSAFVLIRNKKQALLVCVVLVFVLLVNGVVSAAFVSPGSHGRMEKSVSGALLSRVVWPNFVKNGYFWNTNITDIFTSDELLYVSQEPERVFEFFGPRMEETYGIEMAHEQYMKMVKASWEVGTKEVVTEVGKDLLFYLFPMTAEWEHLRGNGVSYVGAEYDVMQAKAPIVAKYYVNLSLVGFHLSLVVILLMLLVDFVKDKSKHKMPWRSLAVIGPALFMALWYALASGGMQSTGKVPFVSILWAFMILTGINSIIRKENKDA